VPHNLPAHSRARRVSLNNFRPAVQANPRETRAPENADTESVAHGPSAIPTKERPEILMCTAGAGATCHQRFTTCMFLKRESLANTVADAQSQVTILVRLP
jgi:hypothetical protein